MMRVRCVVIETNGGARRKGRLKGLRYLIVWERTEIRNGELFNNKTTTTTTINKDGDNNNETGIFQQYSEEEMRWFLLMIERRSPDDISSRLGVGWLVVGSSRGLWIIGNTTTYNPSLLGLLAVGTCAASTLRHPFVQSANTIPEVLSTRRQKSWSKDWPRMLSKDTGQQPYLIRWSRTALDNSVVRRRKSRT
jgi:hypothetical protein